MAADLPVVADGGDHGRAVPGQRRARVVLVAHGIHDGGGMERACAELIRHLHRQSALVVVACELAPDLRPLVERWIRLRVPMRPIPLKFVCFQVRAAGVVCRLPADLRHTVGAIVPNRVDVATVHVCQAGIVARMGRLAAPDAPLARRVNSGLGRALALLAERWSYRPGRLRALAAVSPGVQEELASHYPAVPCVVTPNGVDLRHHGPDGTARARVRRDMGVKDEVVAIFVGGSWFLKGVAITVEAVAKARAAGSPLQLWVVGAGDAERFSRMADALGVAGAVRFLGHRDDVADFYRAADLFVLPSVYETFSLVTLEAAATGLPLVVTDFSGGLARALTGDGDGGRIVARDATSVAEALGELAADPQLRHRLGATARARAGPLPWTRSAQATGRLYRSLR